MIEKTDSGTPVPPEQKNRTAPAVQEPEVLQRRMSVAVLAFLGGAIMVAGLMVFLAGVVIVVRSFTSDVQAPDWQNDVLPAGIAAILVGSMIRFGCAVMITNKKAETRK